MGQRVYLLGINEKFNIVGIYTNIRQVHKTVKELNQPNLDNIFLHEIRMNEPPSDKFGRECKYMLIQKQKEMDRHKILLEIQHNKKLESENTFNILLSSKGIHKNDKKYLQEKINNKEQQLKIFQEIEKIRLNSNEIFKDTQEFKLTVNDKIIFIKFIHT